MHAHAVKLFNGADACKQLVLRGLHFIKTFSTRHVIAKQFLDDEKIGRCPLLPADYPAGVFDGLLRFAFLAIPARHKVNCALYVQRLARNEPYLTFYGGLS